MAKLRKGVAYRRLERPYTRRSRYLKLNYIRASPPSKVTRYNMGNPHKKFEVTLNLKTKSDLQIRHNSIESARQSSNRLLEKVLGKDNYYYMIRIYPHHILRENPLATGAGADRMSTGMQKAYGKPIGLAAQVHKGQTIFSLNVNKPNIKTARLALKRASHKIACSTTIEINENKV